jgi:polyisoprenoid-binding protein YceI
VKRTLAAAAAAAALALPGGAATAQPAVYRLDPEHSFVHFEVLHFGTSTIRGRFGPLQGTVALDRAARRGEVGLAVDTATVSTGLGIFDARLREDDLLASAAHPQAFFVATRFRFDGDRVAAVRGEFTLRGTSQPLELKARLFGCRHDGAREVCGGDFEAELLRSSFGATFGLPFVADRVRLVVQVQGERD